MKIDISVPASTLHHWKRTCIFVSLCTSSWSTAIFKLSNRYANMRLQICLRIVVKLIQMRF